jgi:hypothetical protein
MTNRQLEIIAFALAYLDDNLVEAITARKEKEAKTKDKGKFRPPSSTEVSTVLQAVVKEMK